MATARLPGSVPWIVVALWVWLAIAGVLVVASGIHAYLLYPVIATVSVAIAAFCGWRVCVGDFRLGAWHQVAKLWWPYWVIIVVGAIATGGMDYTAVLRSLQSPSGVATAVLGWFVAPICEEVLFRGVLLRWLYTRFSDHHPAWYSIVISALAFGISHAVNFVVDPNLLATSVEVASAVAFGLLVGFGYTRSWNLYGAVIAHILGNILTVA